jgi:hypothetical protein
MSDTIRNLPPIPGLTSTMDNNPLAKAFAVRGIGAYGQDVHCSTVLASTAAHALMLIFVVPGNAAAIQDATAWVVTRLKG